MGDGGKTPLRIKFNPKIRLGFHGTTINPNAELVTFRELDDVLGLTHISGDYFTVTSVTTWSLCPDRLFTAVSQVMMTPIMPTTSLSDPA